MNTTTIDVTGMTCDHCVRSVKEEVSAIAGVTDVQVELHTDAASKVTITSDAPLADTDIKAAIDEAGYVIA